MLRAEQEAADLKMKAEGLIQSEENEKGTDTAVAMGSEPMGVDTDSVPKYVRLCPVS